MATKTIITVPVILLACAITATPAATYEIEEVVVTAEKRTKSIQDVPMSVAAIGGDDVGIGKITGMDDVAMTTPGISFNQFNLGEPRIFIRGIGNTSDSAASDSAVGIFIDEVYIGRTGGSGFDLFDLERIEILRGPQGTLYGKNTNGGAINFITSRPTQEPSTKLSLTAGNQGLIHAQALLNGGLTDSVSGKISIATKQRDGFYKNVITDAEIINETSLTNSPIIGNSAGAAGSGDELGDIDNQSLRAQLLFDVSSDTTLLLSADYSQDESNGSCRHLENLDQGILGTGALWALGMSEAYNADKRQCASQFDTGQERKIQGVMARIEHDLKWASLLSISAWRASDYTTVDDLTGLPLNEPTAVLTVPENVIDGVDEEASQFSQEFRLSGTHENIDWIAGVFYMEEQVERDEQFYTQFSVPLQELGLAPIGNVLFVQDNTTTSLATYGQLDWRLSDQWTLTYGIRWSRDEKEITQDAQDLLGTGFPTGVPLILPEFTAPVKGEEDWSEVTHKASINYHFSINTMVYLTYAEGFKSGAFPSQTNLASNATQTVDPEIVENIELGLKSSWYDNRLQFNLSFYHMDYNNLQVFELTPTLLLVLNNAQAKSKGFEASITVAPTENLLINASFNSGEARYEEFITASGADLTGNTLPNASDESTTLDTDYSLPLSGGSTLDFNVNYSWKSEYYTSSSNDNKVKQDAIGRLGATVTWHSADELLSVGAWGKNLGDKDQIAHRIVDPTGITSEKYMPPKTYGVTVTKSF
ncbi:TonB-dependent receptor [Microbulbifer sp. SSSA002]|uniref:TonB-dependent receptor n=1 Tax=unclassified Microbulbifer TaxID=2619833 RepID=UPI0040396BAB